MTNPDDYLFLASQSPRRRELLDQLGVAYQLLLPDAHEDAESLEAVLPGEAPRHYVQRVTALKLEAACARLARATGQKHSKTPVLCADTTVAMGRRILGKPANDSEALEMLAALSGRTHRVLTAVAISAGRRTVHALSESRVTFAPMSRADRKAYVATGEPMGKAGAYGVQGRAAAHIVHISGSYSGIMGLPLFETAQALRSVGFKF